MTRTPTAEEVLGLLSTACDSYNSEPFITAYQQWQAAQGPVTREWFEERFRDDLVDGDLCETVYFERGAVRIFYCHGDIFLQVHDLHVSHFANVKLHNPTRSDIETLVRVLGGT